MWRKGNPRLWERRLVQPLWKTVWSVLKKLKMELLYDPVVPLLGGYLKKPETLIGKNVHTPIFTAVLLTIARLGSSPNAHQCMSGYKGYGAFTQWNTTQL